MQDEQAEQTDEPVEASAEETEGADTEAAASDDAEAAEAVDMQATQGGAGETVLKQPEVPDDANDTIAAAQQHIDNLNMDKEREAAERAQKSL